MPDKSVPIETQPARVPAQANSAFYNDPRFRAFIYQGLLVVGVVALFWWLASNAQQNLAAQNKQTGFAFLDQPAGFGISFSLIPFDRASSYLQVYFVGILNTLLVASIGIVLATMLGFVIGIARLSSNFLIRQFAAIYVETIRNMPLLLQLLFWYFLMLNALPAVRNAITLPFGIALHQRGLNLPALVPDDRFIFLAVAIVVAVIAGLVFRRWSLKQIENTGRRRPVWLPMLAIIIVPIFLVYFISGTRIAFDFPELRGFNFRGGFTAPPELTALVLGLVVYTAAFIAEIVRAGIQSVSHGQTEAASALGLKEGDRLRLVIVPQAMRVIIPPLTSQYLNLTKNSSLGAAIGFPELVNVYVGTALNQSGRAIEIIGMAMLVYLTFSLTTSIVMNWYNSRVALVER
ncbi:general L-amino acid transport system permease protein [Devosia enhydra]|uniref:General L-amino acid transport system permease protein n=1 Tax=Devosia enhydra TaxID=665118 RepID=A0A1K2HWL9_9HYPH|nr:ABC transporter permease subunit [Devosia enhydra]SFZ82484.1 general L-amino acid transport system permease protein [Devosia enhydra]